jgi:hypothetical protein
LRLHGSIARSESSRFSPLLTPSLRHLMRMRSQSRPLEPARTFVVVPHILSQGLMRASHIFILFFVIPQCILTLSPPKQRPSRSNAPDAQPSSDSSIIVPLYKEALKADAEGRPEDSLRLLSTPPLSLAPGILSTCCPPPSPPSLPPLPPLPPPPPPTNPAFPAASTLQDVNVSFCSTIRLYMKLRRWDEAEQRVRDASDRDAMSLTCATRTCHRIAAPTIFCCNHISCFPGIWPSCLRVAASSIHLRGCCCRSGSRAGAAT